MVNFAGEVYPVDELHALQAALPPSVRLLNLYGPTETNVCTFWEVTSRGAMAGRKSSHWRRLFKL